MQKRIPLQVAQALVCKMQMLLGAGLGMFFAGRDMDMTFQISCELDYSVPVPVVFLLNIRAQKNAWQKVLKETFTLVPQVPLVEHVDTVTGNRFDQISAEVPGVYHIRYSALVETRAEVMDGALLPETDVHEFPLEVLGCLYASRYCQSDRLGALVSQQFDQAAPPLARVREVVRWLRERIAYVSGSTHASTSAVDTLVERQGVCRDFAHLGIALCRAMNIPARYFTGYAHELNPPDFHACFETWIGGRWLLWDATGLASPDAVVRIGTGRDAADVSVCTAFGNLRLERQKVVCEALDPGYEKLMPSELEQLCISHAS